MMTPYDVLGFLMSTLFPIAELLMIVVFAATVAAALATIVRRGQSAPVDHGDPEELIATPRRESASHTETDFPSTAVC